MFRIPTAIISCGGVSVLGNGYGYIHDTGHDGYNIFVHKIKIVLEIVN